MLQIKLRQAHKIPAIINNTWQEMICVNDTASITKTIYYTKRIKSKSKLQLSQINLFLSDTIKTEINRNLFEDVSNPEK